jgi:hypothetical protein
MPNSRAPFIACWVLEQAFGISISQFQSRGAMAVFKVQHGKLQNMGRLKTVQAGRLGQVPQGVQALRDHLVHIAPHFSLIICARIPAQALKLLKTKHL